MYAINRTYAEDAQHCEAVLLQEYGALTQLNGIMPYVTPAEAVRSSKKLVSRMHMEDEEYIYGIAQDGRIFHGVYGMYGINKAMEDGIKITAILLVHQNSAGGYDILRLANSEGF